jgi:hypothetical protein
MPPAFFYVFHNLIPFMELRYLYRWGSQNATPRGLKMKGFLQGFATSQNERVSKCGVSK